MKRWSVIGALLLAAGGAAWWGLRGQTPDTPQGDSALRVGITALPPKPGNPFSSFGIPSIYTWSAIFEGLTFVTEDGEVTGALANAWTQIDKLTWRITLRNDVMFHSGRALTSTDVAWTLNFVISPAAAEFSIAREVGFIESARAVDATSVDITLTAPNPALPRYLALIPIVDATQWQSLGAEGFSRAPSGTGPYQVTAWRDNGATLKRFDKAWRKAPSETLDLIVIPDPVARLQSLTSNRIDIAVLLGPDQVTEAQTGTARVSVSRPGSVIGLAYVLTAIPATHPLADVRVRRALNMAVNRAAYIENLLSGVTRAAVQPATPSVSGYDAAHKDVFDPAAAKTLLAEAGYAKGFSFTLTAPLAGGADSAVLQRVAADLAQVGVTMIIRATPVPQFVRYVQEGGWPGEAFVMNFQAERSLDGLRFTRIHSCRSRTPWYCRNSTEELVMTAEAEANAEARTALTQQVVGAYVEDATALWLHEATYITGLGSRIDAYNENFGFTRYDLITLHH
jgi:ABC-type transport system substrate-binding protein